MNRVTKYTQFQARILSPFFFWLNKKWVIQKTYKKKKQKYKNKKTKHNRK